MRLIIFCTAVVKVNVLLSDMSNYDYMNVVYAECKPAASQFKGKFAP